MKRLIKFFVAAFFVSALVFALIGGYGWKLFNDPGPLVDNKTLVLKSGSGLAAISTLLEQSGIIRNKYAFQLGVRLKNKATALKAGEYEFVSLSSGLQIMELLVSGKTVIHKITIPEGFRSRQIADMVAQAYGLSGGISIDLVEGSLLPETYHYKFGDTRNQLLRRMQKNMKNLIYWAY